MDNMTLDDYLDKFREEQAQFLDGVLSSLAEHDVLLISLKDPINELEKYGKLLQRAQKSNNYGPVRKYTGTTRFKAIFESTLEQSQNDPLKVCDSVSVNVKKEKLSITSGSSLQSVAEDCDSMPAPKMPAPKKKRVKKEKASIGVRVKVEPGSDSDNIEKRVTRSKVANRSSDVIIQNPVIPVIELDDSLDKTEELPIRSSRTKTVKKDKNGPSRSTRTNAEQKVEEKEIEKDVEVSSRTTKTKQKRDVSTSDNITVEMKASNSHEVPPNTSTQTEYEDALPHLENRTDATFVVPSESTPNENIAPSDLNKTVVIEKKKIHTSLNNGDNMLTDDESLDEETISTKQKPKPGAEQVFSPYENSPVKKKVEAFEKLQKKECAATSSKQNTSKILKEIENNKGNVLEKAKTFVGKQNASSSASKLGKYIHQASSSMLNNTKGANEARERELRRQERKQELKKKEILKQIMSAERKKAYDEKIMKLQQQQKDALEKEKEKALEIQRIKDERYRKVLQMKEERQKQLKEENERRRLLAKQRAEDKKKEEEALRTGPQNKRNRRNENEAPIYLVQPTPPLPCDDCYDSDDERFNQTRMIPSWASKSQVMKQDHLQTSLGHKIKNTLFYCQSQNIDLRDVFQTIDPRKLKRTSSANWGKPPRFTILPSTIE